MTLPPNLHKKYLDRFDQLIQEGESLYQGIKDIPRWASPAKTKRPWTQQETECHSKVEGWLINYQSLLDQILPLNSVQRQLFTKKETHYLDYGTQLKQYVSRLKGFKDDFANGLFSDLSLQIEAEIVADYMGQAEQLLAEGQTGQYDHVPAAVLAGAVLEKGLRTLCTKQTPPLPLVDPKGNPLMMNRLIDDLKKAGVFNELKAKHLRAWADIRNKAAHGEFSEFNRNDVGKMIGGINDFLADYLS